jgi:cytochrome P450
MLQSSELIQTRFIGPIVRVNPYELSIRDSSFYDQLYVPASVRPTDGYHRFAAGVDFEGSHVFTTAHDLHRTRRKPLEPYFSRQGVAQLEPTLQDLAAKLVDRLQEAKETSNGKAAVVRLDHAMLCFTGDVINHVCCKNPTSLLDDTDFSAEFYESLHAPLRAFPVFEAFPSLIRVMRLVPDSVVAWLHPGSRFLKIFREKAERLIHEVKDEQGLDEKEEGCTGKRMTLFSHLIDGNALPEDEMNKTRLVNEAQVLLAAGTIGTSRVLDLTCFYVLASSDIRTRLAEELRAVMAEYPRVKPTRAQLEKLPYFQGVIKEGLRQVLPLTHIYRLS